MKATGIIRRIDEVGRVVLPKELRNLLQMEYVEFFVNDDNEIVLKRYAPACIFCNMDKDIIEFEGHKVCKNCIDKMENIIK